MEYLLKANGIVIMLFLFYYIFLKNETFFKSIRFYFLIGLLLVISIPLIEIPVYVERIAIQINLLDYQTISSKQLIEENSFDWIYLLTFTYLIGVVIFSIKFLIQFISLRFLLSKHQLVKKGNYYFVETTKNISPFSFFNIIIYNKSQFSIDELNLIINHEKAHAIQWHSLDTILAHLLVITLWFNPFVWLYKKAVQQNLEFLADEYAFKLTNNRKKYQLILLKSCNTSYCTSLTNNFYNSLIKKRIIMLHQKRSQNKYQWKYALLLPLLVVFITTFNTKVIAQEKKLLEVEEINSVKIELVIDKNSTDEHLKKETKLFKKEFNIALSFKGLRRNSKNEITAIKIDAKGNNLRAKLENSGTSPIKPIKISYDSDGNYLNISNLRKLHKNHYTYTIHENDDIKLKGESDEDGNFVFITSKGKKNKWKQKNGKSENIELKVKVTELEEGKHSVKIIEEIEKIKGEGEHEIEIINEDNASENIFIIKSGNNKTINYKITKKGDFVVIDDNGEKPIVFINGKESAYKTIEKLDSDKIESITILKGKSATSKYGDKGKNGVILIRTKKE